MQSTIEDEKNNIFSFCSKTQHLAQTSSPESILKNSSPFCACDTGNTTFQVVWVCEHKFWSSRNSCKKKNWVFQVSRLKMRNHNPSINGFVFSRYRFSYSEVQDCWQNNIPTSIFWTSSTSMSVEMKFVTVPVPMLPTRPTLPTRWM